MLYYLDSSNKKKLQTVKQISLHDVGWDEENLEDLLASNIENLVRADQLLVIAQERKMQAEADIMAVDEKGTLYLFELKRWRSNEDNLLQVLRYGQRFGRYEYGRLNNFFHSYQHRRAKSVVAPLDLRDAHAQYFDLEPERRLSESDFNQQQRFIVVTNGLDVDTWEAIEYWKKYKLPVDAIVYRVYRNEDTGQVMVDFDPYGPEMMAPDPAGEGLFVVNTNKTHDSGAYRDMLDNNKAAGYYSRKHGIASIAKGSQVCLYHVGVGVVAIGKARDSYMMAPVDNDPDEEYFVPCDFDYKVDPDTESHKAVKAWEINQKFGTGHRFRQTVFSLPSDFASFIREEFRKKTGI